ncbi:MAG: DUF1893 domain-containing protein [Clostridiales bacterium]|nr:DUF1893 domain-containing protein [Clostridiales bacterium]
MTDLQIAKNNLSGHTICLCKNGDCIYSDKRGISPMMGFIADGVDLSDYSVADLVVGRAAAMLFKKCGIKAVFAKTISRPALSALQQFGVECEYETLADRIINRDGTDVCPMEKTVLHTDDPDEAYALLKDKLKSLNGNK